MIKINSQTVRRQHNFWNHCLFHPTDAIEDSWGKRNLDLMAADRAVRTVRLYTMLEDIVYTDEHGQLQYDFRINDLRLDYLLEKGFDILLAYAGVPDCIAQYTTHKASNSKNGTRYKGKLFNTSPPRDYALWEEVCYEYTRHIVERYGIETVSQWHCQCYNEPDGKGYWLGHLPAGLHPERYTEYYKLYQSFERGVRRVSDRIRIGGPAFGFINGLGDFLDFVRNNQLKLDYIPIHNYGVPPRKLNDGTGCICVENSLRHHREYMDVIRAHGFEGIEVICDEWGAASGGFRNLEDCPALIFRENEVFPSYYTKLIRGMIDLDPNLSKMMICLSGQHEMVNEFSGFRGFFTLNFLAKPIYNGFVLASKLGENLLSETHQTEHLYVIPTKNDNGNYTVLLTYSSNLFEENLPVVEEILVFDSELNGKTVTIWCIDKNTTNPYRLYQKLGVETLDDATLKTLREEGHLKPIFRGAWTDDSGISLKLTANSTFLITVDA